MCMLSHATADERYTQAAGIAKKFRSLHAGALASQLRLSAMWMAGRGGGDVLVFPAPSLLAATRMGPDRP